MGDHGAEGTAAGPDILFREADRLAHQLLVGEHFTRKERTVGRLHGDGIVVGGYPGRLTGSGSAARRKGEDCKQVKQTFHTLNG